MDFNMGLTQKQEKFTLNLFKGMYQRDAYIDAYQCKYALSTVDSNASRLANNVKVKARLEELRKAAEDASIANVRERQQRLTEIVRARLIDFVDNEGNIQLEVINNGALQEVVVSEFTLGGKEGSIARNTRVKLNDPQRAIDLLNKMDKIYDDGVKVQILNVIDPRSLTDEQLAIIAGGKDLAGRSGDRTLSEAESP